MADAIEEDRLINVYGGGGHTTLCMGEMFFRAGGLAPAGVTGGVAFAKITFSLGYCRFDYFTIRSASAQYFAKQSRCKAHCPKTERLYGSPIKRIHKWF